MTPLEKVLAEMAADLERAKRQAKIWDEIFEKLRTPDFRDGRVNESDPFGEQAFNRYERMRYDA